MIIVVMQNVLNIVQFVMGKLIFFKYFQILKNLKNDELSFFVKVKINFGYGLI